MDKHNVRRGKMVLFGDDVERHIKPLSIKQLRKFVTVIEKLGNTASAESMTDEDIDTMAEAAEIILSKVDPNLANDREALEDAVDLVVFNEMMTVAMGNSAPEE